MKVIIIGAGIAGLTCAYACQQAGMEVRLYEKTRVLRNIGGGILIWPHGLRYLKWLGLAETIAAYQIAVQGCEVYGHAGDKIFAESYQSFFDLVGGGILPIDRSLLQKALLTKLRPATLVLNKQCTLFEAHDNHAAVFFNDGTSDTADLVIGADGIHSPLRKFLTTQEPGYTNYCWWGGIVAHEHVPYFNKNEVYMAMGVNKLCIIWPTCNDQLMWYLPVKMPLSAFSANFNDIKNICADWLPEVEQLLMAPNSAQSFHLPIHALPANTPRIGNRLILIGDASHALGPILGQGASQAIEDVFVLVNCLKKYNNNLSEVLSAYETLRFPKYQSLNTLETLASTMMIHDNLADLENFQLQLANVNLATMYQELIPLVDEKACQKVASSFPA